MPVLWPLLCLLCPQQEHHEAVAAIAAGVQAPMLGADGLTAYLLAPGEALCLVLLMCPTTQASSAHVGFNDLIYNSSVCLRAIQSCYCLEAGPCLECMMQLQSTFVS